MLSFTVGKIRVEQTKAKGNEFKEWSFCSWRMNEPEHPEATQRLLEPNSAFLIHPEFPPFLVLSMTLPTEFLLTGKQTCIISWRCKWGLCASVWWCPGVTLEWTGLTKNHHQQQEDLGYYPLTQEVGIRSLLTGPQSWNTRKISTLGMSNCVKGVHEKGLVWLYN